VAAGDVPDRASPVSAPRLRFGEWAISEGGWRGSFPEEMIDLPLEKRKKEANEMKIFCRVAFGIFVLWGIGLIIAIVFANYHYNQKILSYWNLADKASTIYQKSEYLDEFVNELTDARLADNDALFLKTADNNVAQNMIALKSLQGRMHEISHMDVSSFAYQQAISEITAQEQGEAGHLLDVFEGAWYLENHFFLWEWIGVLHCLIVVIGIVLFGIGAFFDIFE
jgi:hypothetical protein